MVKTVHCLCKYNSINGRLHKPPQLHCHPSTTLSNPCQDHSKLRSGGWTGRKGSLFYDQHTTPSLYSRVHKKKWIDKWLLSPSQPWWLYQGNKRRGKKEIYILQPCTETTSAIPQFTPMRRMKWRLMSSDVSWHIRDKLWPMPKHGSIILYVHGNQKAH